MSSGTAVRVRFAGSADIVDLPLRPVGLMATERKFGGNAFNEHPIEATLYAAWSSNGMPGGPDGFNSWAASIDELVNDAAGGTLPPPAEPSSDPSPLSP